MWKLIPSRLLLEFFFFISLRLSQQVDLQRHILSWNVSSFNLQHSKSWHLDLLCVFTARAFPRLAVKLAFSSLSLIITAVQNKRESQKSREREIVCMSSKLKQTSQSAARNCHGNRPQSTQWHHFNLLLSIFLQSDFCKTNPRRLSLWCSYVSEKSPQQECALCAGRCGDDFGQLSECVPRQASANYEKSFALTTHKNLKCWMKRLREILIQYLCEENFQFGLVHRSL